MKGYEKAQKGKTVVFLIPSRTDTLYWHSYIMKANEIRFIKGRLHFDDAEGAAPFPSAIVVFRGRRKWTRSLTKIFWLYLVISFGLYLYLSLSQVGYVFLAENYLV